MKKILQQLLKQRIVCLFLVLYLPALLPAQESNYQQAINEATILANQRRYDEAEKEFRRALKIKPKDINAYLLLGDLNMRQKNWGDAKSWFDKVFDQQPDNIEAHYQTGICDREDAIGREQVMKRIYWRNSAKHFRAVIELDSLYKEVFGELAHLERHRGNYEEAIDLCLKQLRLKHTEAIMSRSEIFSFYEYFLNNAGHSLFNVFKDVNDYQITWLKNRSADYDSYYLGEKYRRIGRYPAADSIFLKLLNKKLAFPKIPIRLSRVRLHYEINQPEMAETLYWETLGALQSFTEIKFIYDDIKYIMSDEDLTVSFKSIETIREYYRRFWNRKNPLPGATINARLAEHYRRLIKAEHDFIYDGWRLPIDNPDRMNILKYPAIFSQNSKFNDKGLVYLRYGEPDDIAVYSGQSVAANESWLYHETQYNPKMIFHFEVNETSAPGNWRLIPIPSQREMLESRLGWDQKLDRYYLAGNILEESSVRHELENDASQKVPSVLNRERHSWEKKFASIPLYLSTARFRGVDNTNHLEIYFGIPKDQIFTAGHNSDSIRFDTGLAIYDSLWDEKYKKLFNYHLTKADTVSFKNSFFLEEIHTDTDLNRCYVSTHVTDQDLPRLGGHKFRLNYKPYTTENLEMSDLLLAYLIEPATQKDKFYKHGLRVIPNPSQKFYRSGLVYLYFEVYNLQVHDEQSRYKIEQIVKPFKEEGGLWNGIKNLFSSKGKTVSISKEQQGASTVSYEYTALDFSSFSVGKYEIIIIVNDLYSGKSCQAQRIMELY